MKHRNRGHSPFGKIIHIFIILILGTGFVLLLYTDRRQEQEKASRLEKLNQQMREDVKERRESEAAEKAVLEQKDSFYQKLADGLDVNILIIGDSIGEGAGSSSEKTNWVYLLQEDLHKEYDVRVTVTNLSMGGNSSYAGYVRTMNLNDDIDYDLAILCYGQNDPENNFSLYYESMIRAVKNRYDGCALISILESSQKTYTAKMRVIQELAEYYNIPVADTIAPFQDNYNDLVKDGVHPNDSGYRIYFERIKAVIDNNVEVCTPKDKSLYKPVNTGVEKFDSCRYISKDEFEAIDDYTLETEIKIRGVMGIDYTYQSGDNKCIIYIDDEEYVAPVVTFNYDFSQRHILIVGDDCSVEKTIRIEFMEAEQCEGFKGIVFSGTSR